MVCYNQIIWSSEFLNAKPKPNIIGLGSCGEFSYWTLPTHFQLLIAASWLGQWPTRCWLESQNRYAWSDAYKDT